jgi:hypothetical protein
MKFNEKEMGIKGWRHEHKNYLIENRLVQMAMGTQQSTDDIDV